MPRSIYCGVVVQVPAFRGGDCNLAGLSILEGTRHSCCPAVAKKHRDVELRLVASSREDLYMKASQSHPHATEIGGKQVRRGAAGSPVPDIMSVYTISGDGPTWLATRSAESRQVIP